MINPKLLERYRKSRADGHPASRALYYARQLEPAPLEWRYGGKRRAEWVEDGFHCCAMIVHDSDGSPDYLGKYSRNYAAGAILNHKTRKWFIPANQEQAVYRDLRAMKYGRRLARDLSKSYVYADKRRLDNFLSRKWEYIGIVVGVAKDGEALGSESLWGIESDSGQDYIDSTAYDLAAEALAEARNKLAEIRNAA